MAAAVPFANPESTLPEAPAPAARLAPADLAPEARTDAQRLRVIRDAIRARSEALRARFPLLQRRQSEIGLGLLLASLAAMVGCGALYAAGVLPAWVCIPLVAMACSIAHEIEHDLIHNLYFPRHPKLQNAMFATVWAMRPNTVSPWVRRHLHIRHHRVSGTEGDIEERSITNGEPWGVRRVLMMADGMLSTLLRLHEHDPATRRAVLKASAKAYFPLGFVHHALWYGFLAYHAVDLAAAALGAPIAWSGTTLGAMRVVDFLAVVILAPNVLRSFCLHFVSSNMHYYGDVEKGNVMQQTQVLNRWWLAPLHLFCFNFGATHAIHHFWVPDPFYLRQATAPTAHRVFRENGVRFNDLGTFRRANRYHAAA